MSLGAFEAAARALIMRVDLATLDWKQYDLGVLRAKLGEELRIHIWHPSLRTLATPISQYGGVHDHRFDVTSAVVAGEITNVTYEAHPAHNNEAEIVDRARGANVEVDGFAVAREDRSPGAALRQRSRALHRQGRWVVHGPSPRLSHLVRRGLRGHRRAPLELRLAALRYYPR